MPPELRIIDGRTQPAPLAPHVVKRRYQQLRSIERLVRQAQYSPFSPRTNRAVAVALWVAAGLFGLFALIGLSGFVALTDTIRLVPLLVGIVTWAGLLRWGTYPTSWTVLVDQALDAYDPVDLGAYRNLQQRTRDAGYIDLDEVRIWQAVEWSELGVATGRLTLGPRSFTNKKV